MFHYVSRYYYKSTLEFLTLLCISLFIFVNAYGASGECYVFYRGHHILNNVAYDPAIMDARGIMTRPISNGLITGEDININVKKMADLNREWTKAERAIFKPTCPTPYQELVELYTNFYSTFTAQLRDQTSRTRRILNLVGIDVMDNFFVSTSLKPDQAYKYGAGLKLFDHEELRRYPEYNGVNEPENPVIGYVDVICVPKTEITNLSPFFVVESFSTGATKLAHHFRKNLTEEQEVIFPFLIDPRHHVARFPIILPSLVGGIKDGLHHPHWRTALRGATTAEGKKAVELKIVKAWVLKRAEDLEKETQDSLKKNRLMRVSASPAFSLYGRTLVPSDSIKMRKQIINTERLIQASGYNQATRSYNLRIDRVDFILSHAINRIAANDYPVSITFGFSMMKMRSQLLAIFLRRNNICRIKFDGDVYSEGIIQVCADSLYTRGAKYNYDNSVMMGSVRDVDKLWLSPRPARVQNFVEALEERQSSIEIDLTRTGIHPDIFSLLQHTKNVTAIDPTRKVDHRAYRRLINATNGVNSEYGSDSDSDSDSDESFDSSPDGILRRMEAEGCPDDYEPANYRDSPEPSSEQEKMHERTFLEEENQLDEEVVQNSEASKAMAGQKRRRNFTPASTDGSSRKEIKRH